MHLVGFIIRNVFTKQERPFKCEHNSFKLCGLYFVVNTSFGPPTRPLSDLVNFLNVHVAEISFFLISIKTC